MLETILHNLTNIGWAMLIFQCILFSVLQHQSPAGTVQQGKADKLRLEDHSFCLWSDPAVCGYYHAAAVCGYGRVGNSD